MTVWYVSDRAICAHRSSRLEAARRPRTPISVALLCVGVAATSAVGLPLPFDTPVILPGAPDAPLKVAAGDLDADGDLDLLSASQDDGVIRWFENDGAIDPAFTERTVSAAAPGASAVAVGDIDGDGDLDVIACSDDDDKVAWHENTGGAPLIFVEHILSEDPDGMGAMEGDADSPIDIIASDLDSDGDLDIVVAALGAGSVLWFDNDGASSPSFTLRTVQSGLSLPRSVGCADVDQDGDLDVMSVAFLGNAVQWHENDGASPPGFTLRVASNSVSFPTDVDCADIDGDGDIDLVASSSNDDSVRWFENFGFSPPIFIPHVITAAAGGAISAQAVDLDGDGDVDVLGASPSDNRITWYENDGASPPAFTTHTIRFGEFGANDALAADYDGDGDLDVVGAIRSEDSVTVYENRLIHREASFLEGVALAAAGDPRGLSSGDVNRDGHPDVLVASSADDTIRWLLGDGTRGLPLMELPVSTSVDGAFDVVTADVNHDGFLDVVCAADDENQVLWFEHDGMESPAFSEHVIDATALGARSVAVADIDGDGELDVAAALEDEDAVVWYDQTPAGVFTRRVLSMDAAFASDVVIFDLNEDGRLDVAATSRQDDGLRWFENQGGDPATFTERVITIDPDGVGPMQGEINQPNALCVADLDGDGDPDLATASASDSSVVFWENMGGDPLVFVSQTLSSSVQFAWDVMAADLDADGDNDLVATALLADTVVTFINDGDSEPVFERRDASGPAPFPHAALPVDLDRDGDVDIVSSALTGAAVLLHENVGGQFSVQTMDAAPVSVDEGDETELLRIEITHAGRTGDSPLELVELGFLFQTAPGTPITNQEGEELLVIASLYRDDDLSGDVDPKFDTSVASQTPSGFMNGELELSIPDGSVSAAIDPGNSVVYYLWIDVESMGADSGVSMLNAVHLIADGALLAEDRETDLALQMTDAGNVESSFVEIIEIICPPDLDGDGVVNASDLAELLGQWGTSDPEADLNEDGLVGAADLGLLLGFWNCTSL